MMTVTSRLWAMGVVLLAQLLLSPVASGKDDFLPPERAYRYTTRVEGDRVVFAPLPQLAPKAEAKFRVRVTGLQPGDQRTKVMVTADEVQQPIVKEQSTWVYADQ